MFLLIIPGTLKAVIIGIGLLSFGVLAFITYRAVLRPAMEARADIDSPPPEAGYTYEIVLEQERLRRVSIGQLDSTIKTRLAGVKEDHIVLEFEKDRETEDYQITATAGGTAFWRPPHAKRIESLRGSEPFDSRELIGYPAMFRVGANVRDNRALQYVDFELSTDFFINQFGEEKMRFALTLSRVHPSVDRESRDKRGIFSFGRMPAAGDPTEEEEADDDES